jgi:hypothetical protein
VKNGVVEDDGNGRDLHSLCRERNDRQERASEFDAAVKPQFLVCKREVGEYPRRDIPLKMVELVRIQRIHSR